MNNKGASVVTVTATTVTTAKTMIVKISLNFSAINSHKSFQTVNKIINFMY